MKFSCNTQELAEAVSVVSKALSSKTNIPILEGIKIVAEGMSVTLTAADAELFIQKTIRADIKLEGEAVVSGRFFAEFIKKLTDNENVELEKVSEKMIVRYGINEGEVQCFNEQVYPEIVVSTDDYTFKIKEADLKEVMERTLYCVAVDDTRPILKGCLFELKENTLTAVALDGYRLAVAKVPVIDLLSSYKAVVPGKLLQEVVRILSDRDELLEVKILTNILQISNDSMTVTVRLMEGTYIEYDRIFPAHCYTTVEVKKESLEIGLDRAFLVVKNIKNNHLKLVLRNNTIDISTNSAIGSVREQVSCAIEGKDLEIAFNGKYLHEALSHIKEDFIRIEFASHNAPALIRPLEGDAFNYIILPVRMMG